MVTTLNYLGYKNKPLVLNLHYKFKKSKKYEFRISF